MNRYGGVTLDWYDDELATLKTKFPTADDVPDIIKQANIRPSDTLANEEFALVALDSGKVLRKYACHDPGTTAMSVIYFIEHGDKLPDGAQKLAADNLVGACQSYDLRAPAALVKASSFGGAMPMGNGAAGLGGAMPSAGAGAPPPAAGQGKPLYSPTARIEGEIEGMKRSLKILTESGAVKTAGFREWLAGKIAPGAVKKGPGVIERASAAAGREGGREMGKSLKAEFEPMLKQVRDEVAPTLQEAGTKAVKGAHEAASDIASSAIRKTTGAAALGGAAGGVGGYLSNPEDPRGGALRGILGGLAGGATGAAWGAKGSVAPGVLGALAGGAGAGYMGNRVDAGRPGPRRPVMEVKLGQVVDITGKEARPIVKTARPTSDDDYAVVLDDGSRHYPIDTWDRVKLAEDYLQENRLRMEPRVRRQYAVKLAAKASYLGYPLDPDIEERGSCDYASPGHLKAAIEMRKVACAPGEARAWLDELLEKRAHIGPGTYAMCLNRFDIEQGLNRAWDRAVLDPWESTFGIHKVANVVWEQGADRVTEDQLQNLAQNQISGLQELFNEEFTKEFIKDPKSIFSSMPDPQKKIIARLASDMSSQGGSEVAVVG